MALMPSKSLTPRSCQEKYDEVWKATRLAEKSAVGASEQGEELSSDALAAIICLGVIAALSLIFAIAILVTCNKRGDSSSNSRKNQTAPADDVDVVDMNAALPSVEISKDML